MAANTTLPWTEEELRDKVGQLFIVGFHGHVLSEDIKTLIKVHKVGAVILFLRNVSTAEQLLSLTNSLQQDAKESGHRQGLFIAIDQENGLVTRVKAPVAAQLPGSMALGATGDAENAYKISCATAGTLKAFGVNMNYAPIGDVNSEPKNPVIGVRSPSDDPETVGRFVSAQVRGLKEGGIVPCIKHFPGHGDTAVDSHYGLPVINKTKAQLDECELVPFRRAVVSGVDSVMTAHIALPGIAESKDGDDTSKIPASLNPAAISILRSEMKYNGMIISDCLEMDGVRATFGTENGAVMALKAGTDCVMICHTMAAQVGAIEKVIAAVKSGEISQSAIEASVKRVEALKTKFKITTSTIPESKLLNFESQNSKQATLASEVYAKSTTLVRTAPGSLPLSTSTQKIVFISPGKTLVGGGAVESGEEKTREPYTPASYIDILRSHNSSITDIRFFDGIPLSTEEQTAIDNAETVIFATRNASLSPYQKVYGLSLGKKLKERLVVIATCDPYDFLEEEDEIKNYITIYEPTLPAFVSATNLLFGLTPALGHLPVGNSAPAFSIEEYDNSSTHLSHLSTLWSTIFPTWPIETERLKGMIQQEHGRHYLHAHGFCLTFLMEGRHGKIAAIGVLPEIRRKGLGTALLKKAKEVLVRDGAKDMAIGSVFPRLWPGVPFGFEESGRWFGNRGFRKSASPTARDLFRSIKDNVATPEVLAKVDALPYTFKSWGKEMEEECMMKQRKNFKNIGWINAYARLAASNQHHEVQVALTSSGEQIGWTLACSPTSLISHDFAFLPLFPSGPKTGLIACVGVDEAYRGKGVGLGLLVRAMQDMRRRGVEGICIDWVVIRGFYEKLGFDVGEMGERRWEYEGWDW